MSAASHARIARVPLVVVKTMGRPLIFSGTYSSGELPKSKPSSLRLFLSPPRRQPRSRAISLARSGVSTGIIRGHPPASAATMVVPARSTSMTTQSFPRALSTSSDSTVNTISVLAMGG